MRRHFHKIYVEGQGWQKVELKASENPRIGSEYCNEIGRL